LEGGAKLVAAIAGAQRRVDDGVVLSAFAHRAGAGVERHLMGRAVHHGGVGPEYVLRAIAVVHVEVDDGGALDAVLFLGVTGGDGGVVVEAKSHRARGLGVVAGGARGDEGVCGRAGHHLVDRVHGAAGGAQGGFEASGRHRRVGIEPEQALFRARVADGGHILHGVAKRDGLERGGRRLDAHEGPKSLMSERPVDGPQPVRPLGMAGRREGIEAGGGGGEKGGRGGRPKRGGEYPNGERFARGPSLRGSLAHSHLSPVTLTPGGGAASSGTKKVGASGSRASTRYFSKSVTPSAARKVSSIRKFPVKVRDGFWNTRYAASA